jgi:hypothetical protein
MGYSQAEKITGMVDAGIWSEPRLVNDLQDIPRTIVLQKLK